jgi:hypothetical protein
MRDSPPWSSCSAMGAASSKHLFTRTGRKKGLRIRLAKPENVLFLDHDDQTEEQCDDAPSTR